jgi:hypothetical protein
VRFGLPDEFVGVEEAESRFKEVLDFPSVYRVLVADNLAANLQLVQEHRWANEA